MPGWNLTTPCNDALLAHQSSSHMCTREWSWHFWSQ